MSQFLEDVHFHSFSPVILANRSFAKSDGMTEPVWFGSGMFRSCASWSSVSLQVWSCSQFLQSPSCLYQIWIPFLAEKVTIALVLKCGLYPTKNPLVGSMVLIFILLILAASSSDSWTFELAVLSAL